MSRDDLDLLRAVITQWAVLAMRNVLEKNSENQALVTDLKLRGVAAERLDALREFGVDAEMSGDKVVIKNVASPDRDKDTNSG